MSSIPVRIEGEGKTWPARRLGLLITVIAILLVIAGLIASNIVVADVGEAVVIVDPVAGSIAKIVFGPAMDIKLPWQYTKTVYVAVSTLSFRAAANNAIDALTKDGARISVDVTVRYEIKKNPDVIKFLVTKYATAPREEIERNVMTPIIRQVVRDVISKYTLTEVIENRDQLSQEIISSLREKLEKDETVRLAVEIIDIAVRKIMPPKSVLDAIEAKLKAQQEALAARYQYEKQIILANATKQKMVIEAEGEKQARIIRAEGEKQALELLRKALGNNTSMLLQYLFIENLARYNGTLIVVLSPTGNQTPTFFMLPIRK